MTRDEVQGLHAALKPFRGACLPAGEAMARWLNAHPSVDLREARACALGRGRVPFPAIDGNPPVYRRRPYFDARYHEPRDLHFESDLIN